MRDQGEIRTLQQWVPGPSWASHYMELFYFAIYDKKKAPLPRKQDIREHHMVNKWKAFS